MVMRRRAQRGSRAWVPASLLLVAMLTSAVPGWAATTPKTRRVSVSSAGAEGNNSSYDPSISADGRFVAFHSDASNLVAGDGNGTSDVFVRDRATGKTRRVSVSSAGAEGNGASYNPSISADGRFVAFESSASNLVAGDGNGTSDIFVRGPLR